MKTKFLSVTEFDGVCEVLLNRPAKYNAINLEMAEALFEVARDFSARPEFRVLLIRAEGRYFSAGADLTDPDMFGNAATSPSSFRKWYRNGRGSLHPLFDEFEAVEKPVVVAHQGPCLGGALEMSLSCDFRLAAMSAHYGFPETKLGLLPGSGGTSRLTRLVGPAWARWLIMVSTPVGAIRAREIGLVHEVYEDHEIAEAARSFSRTLAAQPPETIGTAKLAIDLVNELARGEARNVERLANSLLVDGEEHRALLKIMTDRVGKSRKS